jgi:hypothetical protein
VNPSETSLGKCRVPDGGRLDTYDSPPAVPAVNAIRGGCLVASFGVSSDQPETDVESVITLLDDALQVGLPTALLSDANQLSDAFAWTTSATAARCVVWVLDARTFFIWSNGAALLQRLLGKWLELGQSNIVTIIYMRNGDTPGGAVLMSLLGELGFTTRQPDPKDRAIIFAVQRTDGVVVTCFAGPVSAATHTARDWFRDIHARKDLARQAGIESERCELEKEERGYLARRLALPEGKITRAVEWAPKLRALLFKVREQQNAASHMMFEAYRALLEELVNREAHLVTLLEDPVSRSPLIGSYKGTHAVLAAGIETFPDFASARSVVLKENPEAVVNCTTPRNIFKWAADRGFGVAICVDDASDPSIRVFIRTELLRDLADGQIPSDLASAPQISAGNAFVANVIDRR